MSDSEPVVDWLGRGLGQSIKRATKAAGSSYVKVSERTRELGVPIHRTALGKIEKGERDVTVRELVAIAAALDTSPLALLFPDALADVEIFPGVTKQGVEILGEWADDHKTRTALELFDNEEALRLQMLWLRKNELYGFDDKAEKARHMVELLEAEHQRLLDAYKNATEDRSPDA
ncbi:helix-turn-helix domain-containing protein [Mycolicibacterium sphagni]|uniref:HTH cro/C1-type domain-containing protein n=1 Tax=Mycolicibacterium sphagni TaxID=1786 RepID=A0A255DUR1_9MYCO|nr:helix-turn-helix transcriptional regulator [Mycolicibacterium sphagni]OYN82964.1 hypothetical protein CG716_01845 [Mycolicibacterium sphagni]